MSTFVKFFAMIATILALGSVASAIPPPAHLLSRQAAQPVFPDQPPSCPICAANYSSIDSCAQAAPVLANVSMVRLTFSG